MIKIFIYGESSIPEQSTSMQAYWVHRKQADTEMSNGVTKHEEVTKHLKMAVEALGRPVPSGRIGLLLSVLWQCVHQGLHR